MNHMSVSKDDEKFLKEFLYDFYLKVINLTYFNDSFEKDLCDWTNNTLKNYKTNAAKILKLMQVYKESEVWFSSIIGFFNQHGIGCDIDKNKALEMYLLTIKHELSQNINNKIAEYLLSIFYYKDIILAKRNQKNLAVGYSLANVSDSSPEKQPENLNVNVNESEAKIVQEEKSNDINKFEDNTQNKENNFEDNTQSKEQVDTNLKSRTDNSFQYVYSKVDKDKGTFESHLKAAKEGNVKAQHDLAYCYQYGVGVDRDEEQAFKWHLKAAEGGNLKSQCHVGNSYKLGLDVKKDLKKAFEWYLKAAEGGYLYAQFELGKFYDVGMGVDKDPAKCFKWYLRAAERGFSDASTQYRLACCFNNGIGTNKDLKQAFEWYLKSANSGNSNGQYEVGTCYHYGKGTEKNIKEAVKWYEKASTESTNAKTELNNILLKATNEDLEQIFELHLESARSGDSQGQYKAGMCYHYGTGTEKDIEKAIDWLEKALHGKIQNAKFELEMIYSDGQFETNENFRKVFERYLESAKLGNISGQYNVGKCYFYGIGTIRNIEAAINWYEKALYNGENNAKIALHNLLNNNLLQGYQINQYRISRIRTSLGKNINITFG